MYVIGSFALQLAFGSSLRTNGYKKIHTRIKEGDKVWVKRYLERGKNPNVTALGGVTPLYIAAEEGHLDMVQMLVEHGTDVNQKLEQGPFLDFSPVLRAASQGHGDIVEFLLANGVEKDIYLSVILGELEALRSYLEAGEDVNARCNREGDKPYLRGKTLLHLATWQDIPATSGFLLENGVKIDVQDERGDTPLHDAALLDGGMNLKSHRNRNISELEVVNQQTNGML